MKKLLLYDLCARLPFGVMCDIGSGKPMKLIKIEINYRGRHLLSFENNSSTLETQVYLSEVKPYLKRLRDISEEDERLLNLYLLRDAEPIMRSVKEQRWLVMQHYDIYNLIDHDNAIDVKDYPNIYNDYDR